MPWSLFESLLHRPKREEQKGINHALMSRVSWRSYPEVPALHCRWGFQPLDDAIKSHDPILFHLLSWNGARLSEIFQKNAILEASREGSIQMINLLGDSGADLNAVNYDLVCTQLRMVSL
jgi:hypothetical protein